MKLTKKTLRPNKFIIPKPPKNKSKGVVYLSHVPHGFYENEMRGFFSQFGKVTNINIPRSKRTGKYKGYAFIEFLYADVAKIVAETMDNYLMFNKILKAKFVPPEEQKPILFKFPKCETPLVVKRRRFLRNESNRVLTEKECKSEKERLKKSLKKKKKKLENLGINYDFQVNE